MRTSLAGPGTNKWKPKDDTGKLAKAATNTGSYRPTNTAKGPQSSVAEYTPTVDIGKQAPAGNPDDGYRRLGAAAGKLFINLN